MKPAKAYTVEDMKKLHQTFLEAMRGIRSRPYTPTLRLPLVSDKIKASINIDARPAIRLINMKFSCRRLYYKAGNALDPFGFANLMITAWYRIKLTKPV